MILSYSFCSVPVMPVRSEPAHRGEQISQMLYGEKAEVFEINEKGWAKIRCGADGYEGWCTASQLQMIGLREYRKAPKSLSARNDSRLTVQEQELWMPVGSELFGLKHHFSGHKVGFKGKKVTEKSLHFSEASVRHWACAFMHAPYQWGGRSIAGIDCSGLSQLVMKLCGIRIPRDAWQQALEGTTIDFLQHSRAGDLAFFDNAEGKINHVGVLLGGDTIIHASEANGRVAIDKIDPGGIISLGLRKRTHSLRLIRRYAETEHK